MTQLGGSLGKEAHIMVSEAPESSIRWLKRPRSYGSLADNTDKANHKNGRSEAQSKRRSLIYGGWSDSQLPGQSMINVRKFTRSATTTSINEEPKSRKAHSDPDKKGKFSRSASCDLDTERKLSLSSLSGAVFGADIPETESSTQEESEENEEPSRIKAWWAKITTIISSQIGLLLILLSYAFIGAAIFQAIEEPHEKELLANMSKIRSNLINSWNIAKALNNTTFAEALDHKLRAYEEILYESFQHGVQTGKHSHSIWDYWGSLFFSATVFTTIGYGHIAPSTEWGRVATMLYATIGVPLFFVVMANLGRLLTRVIKYFWSYVRKLYYTKSCRRIRHAKALTNFKERVSGKKRHTSSTSTSRKKSTEMTDADSYVDYEVDDQFNLHPFVAITVTVLYIFAGALMYVQWEDWTYLEAFYFIFVSVSTIGFGDLVPDHPKYFLASSVYILLGLSLVAMVINVIMEFFNDTFHKAKEKVEHISRSIGHNLDNADALRKKFPSPKSKSKKETEDNQGYEFDDLNDDPFSDLEEGNHVNHAFSADEAEDGHTVVDITIINEDSEENGHVKNNEIP